MNDWWDNLSAEEFARRICQWFLESRASRDALMLSQALKDFPNPITPGHGVGEWGIEWSDIKAMCVRFGAKETEDES